MSVNATLTYQKNLKPFLIKDLDTQSKHINYIEENKDDYIVVEKHPISTNVKFYDERTSADSSDLQDEKKIQLIKNKALRTLMNEDVAVGYSSMTERYFNDLLKEDVLLLKDILNHIYKDVFDDAEILQKFIEVMSNLDYELLHPTNTILAVGVINHVDVGVQEAALAAFEKWDDKSNANFLKNINYTTGWIEKYAEEIIDYLESC